MPGEPMPTPAPSQNGESHQPPTPPEQHMPAPSVPATETPRIDSDGIPIGVWRELPPRSGPNGEKLPATANVARIQIGEQFVDVLGTIESPLQLSPEQWTDWVMSNIPTFGGLENFSHTPDYQRLSEEQRAYLASPEMIELIREGAGRYMYELMIGIADSHSDLSQTNPNLPPVQVVFTPLDANVSDSAIAFNITGSTIIVVNTRLFETLCVLDPDEVHALPSPDGTPYHRTTASNIMRLLGREEVNHVDYQIRYGSIPSALEGSKVSLAEYDAQPHEFRALLDQRRYVRHHPDEFLTPDDGPSELDVLNNRIRAAVAERRRQRQEARNASQEESPESS